MNSQAHCLVAQANTHPKPAKELALPTHRLTEIKHETLTMYIQNRRDSSKFNGCSPHQLSSNLTGKCHTTGYYSYT
jgi:hypothetical protein